MPTVSKTHYEHGTTLTATELNQPYDDLATASADVDSDNTGSGWMTRKHFSSSATFSVNRCYLYESTSETPKNITSTSWIDLENAAADPAEIDLGLGFQAEDGECLRLSASGMVGETTLGDVNAEGADNYYAFRIRLRYDAGAGDVDVTVREWGYSFTSRARNTEESGMTFATSKIQWQTFQFSTIYQVPADNVNIKKVWLQVCVHTTGYEVEIGRHQLFLIGGRH